MRSMYRKDQLLDDEFRENCAATAAVDTGAQCGKLPPAATAMRSSLRQASCPG